MINRLYVNRMFSIAASTTDVWRVAFSRGWSATVLSISIVLLVACGPGGPNDPVQPTASGLGQFPSVTSSPSLSTTGVQTKQYPRPTVPEWIVQALASPDVQARPNALETWAHQGGRDEVDPLLEAMNDPDEQVRDRVLQLIEQD